ncbi:MAG: PIN domain-containing protein [Candidatus Eisenbacteria bacterium]|nr:PIN domain-containing protein [Candidatus Eisenbacteria bacterium]
MTVAELRAGVFCGTLARKNEAVLERFLCARRVSVLFPDEDTTRQYAVLYRQLREQGTPIPTNDIWIASLVVQHRLRLVSRDAHFDALRQLLRA